MSSTESAPNPLTPGAVRRRSPRSVSVGGGAPNDGTAACCVDGGPIGEPPAPRQTSPQAHTNPLQSHAALWGGGSGGRGGLSPRGATHPFFQADTMPPPITHTQTATSHPGTVPTATPSPPTKPCARASSAAPRGAFQSPTLRSRRALPPAATPPAPVGNGAGLVTPVPVGGRRAKRVRVGLDGPSPPSAARGPTPRGAAVASLSTPLDDADAALDDAVLGGRRARLSRVDAALAALVGGGRPAVVGRVALPPAARGFVEFGDLALAGAAARAARAE